MRHGLYGLRTLGFLICCISVSGAYAADGKALPFHCGFEEETWFEQWGMTKLPENVSLVSTDAERKFEALDGNALRIRVENGGHYGTSFSYPFKKQLGEEPEEVYFRYYIRFADDWDPERGGKLPGFGGTYDRAGWGGRPVDGTDGWSARGLFEGQKDGKTPIGYYCYHVDMRGKYGSNWIWDREQLGFLENNRWYCIEQYVKMNTPGENDGILRGWVDGKLAFERTDLRFRDVETLRVESVWINLYLGGTWSATSEHHLYIDEWCSQTSRLDQWRNKRQHIETPVVYTKNDPEWNQT